MDIFDKIEHLKYVKEVIKDQENKMKQNQRYYKYWLVELLLTKHELEEYIHKYFYITEGGLKKDINKANINISDDLIKIIGSYII